MPKQKLNSYTSEFKESSVELAVESNQPVADTARNLGINVNTLHGWIHKYSKPATSAVKSSEHHFDENKRLKKELYQVTQERDLLKKAAAYFARQTL